MEILRTLSPISQAFIACILLLTIAFNVFYKPKVVELGPTILTTIGIFGTFLGVALGLAHFDTTDVQASVPSLLAGLKTAFWASVFGVGAAVQIKLRELLFGDGARRLPEASGNDILNALVKIREALAGPDWSERLVWEINQLRQDNNERLDSLREAHDGSLRTLSQTASQAIVEQLTLVVKNFNKNVVEQFGGDFSKLGGAVSQLVAWQEQYRETLSQTVARVDQSAAALSMAAGNIKAVIAGLERFGAAGDRVAAMIGDIEAGEDRVRKAIESLAQLVEATHRHLPDLQEALRFSQAGLESMAAATGKSLQQNQKILADSLLQNAEAIRRTQQIVQQDFTRASMEFNQQASYLLDKTNGQLAELDRAVIASNTAPRRPQIGIGDD